jgi:hypothetical protein
MNLILKSLHCLRWKINILFSFPKIRFPTAVFRLLIFSIFAVSIGLLGQYGNAQTNVDPISLIRLDFETGNLSQWIKGPKTTTAINNCHEHDYPANNNTLEVVKSPVKQNIYALEVTLTKNATMMYGIIGILNFHLQILQSLLLLPRIIGMCGLNGMDLKVQQTMVYQ